MNKSQRIFLSITLALVLLSLAPPSASLAQTPEGIRYDASTRFERLSVEDGLPNSTVLSVLQDLDGFMWFATADGLARYDGSEFTVFRHNTDNPNSLSNNNTFCLIQTADGLIWIGTDPGGLNVYDPQTGKFSVYRHNPDDPQSLADDSIWSLREDKNGSIWVGTRGGLSHLDRATGKFTNYLVNAKNPRALADVLVYRIYQDSAGTIWVGTRNGLQRYDPATDDFSIYQNDPKNPNSLSNNAVWAMLEDRQGNFWVGARNGLNLMDRKTGKFQLFPFDPSVPTGGIGDRIWSIFEDKAGYLWVSTENRGLNLFNRQTQEFTTFRYNSGDPFSLSNNDVFWMTEDRSGVLWIASRYGGVNKLSPALQRFGLYRSIPGTPNSLSSNSVYSMLSEKDGILWVGTFGGGLNRIDRKTGNVQVYKNDPDDPESISSDKIYYVYRDQQGILWAATSGGGLNRMDPVTGKFSAYHYTDARPNVIESNFLTVIDSAEDGRLWVGTLGYGLALFNPQKGEMEKVYAHKADDPNSLMEDTVYDLAIDKAGMVWIATARGGLELLDPHTGVITHHINDPGNSNSILSDTVQAAYLDEANGIIWAGTADGLSGLNLTTQQWQNYTVRDGLPNNAIMGIQPGSQNDLWVSTGKGISHFQIAEKTFTNYSARDGLQGDQFEIASSKLGPDGEIFFGGSAGLTFFRPEELGKNPYLPAAVITDFQLFYESVAVGSELLPLPMEKTSKISLNYDQSVFTFKFAALSYQLSSKNLFQYKMEGFDKDWSPARQINQATYTNLSPGTYTFKVRASNNDGAWGETPAQVQIVINPPWWQTWWFQIGGLLLLVFLVLMGYQIRFRAIQATNRELEIRVVKRTREVQDARQQVESANAELQVQLAEITALELKVREQAIRDALTGLHNRHYLSERLAEELSRARRGAYNVAFILVDLDKFKQVNDHYGHPAGDQVLIAVAKIINEQIRLSDFACRVGGEEFLIIMSPISAEIALQRAEKLRSDIGALQVRVAEQIIQVTASIGVAIYPTHAENSDEILSAVDAAMYQAKDAGRNQVVLWTPPSVSPVV
jgi:diguanylate cyclase (GGDEF)-like protein